MDCVRLSLVFLDVKHILQYHSEVGGCLMLSQVLLNVSEIYCNCIFGTKIIERKNMFNLYILWLDKCMSDTIIYISHISSYSLLRNVIA